MLTNVCHTGGRSPTDATTKSKETTTKIKCHRHLKKKKKKKKILKKKNAWLRFQLALFIKWIPFERVNLSEDQPFSAILLFGQKSSMLQHWSSFTFQMHDFLVQFWMKYQRENNIVQTNKKKKRTKTKQSQTTLNSTNKTENKKLKRKTLQIQSTLWRRHPF